MAITRSQLRTSIRTEMKVDPRGKIWDDSEINEAITDSIDEISKDNDYKWEELKKTGTDTTLIDQQEYVLPEDFVTLDLVRLDGNVLDTSTFEELKIIYQSFPSGQPVNYYEKNYKLGLNPIPTNDGGEIDYEYRSAAAPMAEDSDTMIFKDNMKRTVVLQSAFILFSKYTDKKNTERAKSKFQLYEMELGKSKKRNSLGDIAQIHYKTAYFPRTGSSRNNVKNRFNIY